MNTTANRSLILKSSMSRWSACALPPLGWMSRTLQPHAFAIRTVPSLEPSLPTKMFSRGTIAATAARHTGRLCSSSCAATRTATSRGVSRRPVAPTAVTAAALRRIAGSASMMPTAAAPIEMASNPTSAGTGQGVGSAIASACCEVIDASTKYDPPRTTLLAATERTPNSRLAT